MTEFLGRHFGRKKYAFKLIISSLNGDRNQFVSELHLLTNYICDVEDTLYIIP